MDGDQVILQPVSLQLARLLKSPEAKLPAILVGTGGAEFRLLFSDWVWACTQAEYLGGWKRAGTVAPEDAGEGETWSGDYTAMAGQLVTEADAKNLAAALTAVGANLPALLAQAKAALAQFGDFLPKEALEAMLPLAGLDETELAGRAGGRLEHLRELAAYCNMGAFRIFQDAETV